MSSDVSALFAKKKKGKKKKFTSMNANTIEAQEQEEHVDAPPVSKVELAPKDDDGWQDETEEDKKKSLIRANRKEVGELLDLSRLQNEGSEDVIQKLDRIEAKQAIHEAVSRQKQQEEVKKDETAEAQSVVKPWSSRRKANDLSDARQFPSLSDALQNKQQAPSGGGGGGVGAGPGYGNKMEPKQRPKIAVSSISSWLTSDEPVKPKSEAADAGSTPTDKKEGGEGEAAAADSTLPPVPPTAGQEQGQGQGNTETAATAPSPPAPPAEAAAETTTTSTAAASAGAATGEGTGEAAAADVDLKKAEEEVKASVSKEDLVAKFGKKKKKKKGPLLATED